MQTLCCPLHQPTPHRTRMPITFGPSGQLRHWRDLPILLALKSICNNNLSASWYGVILLRWKEPLLLRDIWQTTYTSQFRDWRLDDITGMMLNNNYLIREFSLLHFLMCNSRNNWQSHCPVQQFPLWQTFEVTSHSKPYVSLKKTENYYATSVPGVFWGTSLWKGRDCYSSSQHICNSTWGWRIQEFDYGQ